MRSFFIIVEYSCSSGLSKFIDRLAVVAFLVERNANLLWGSILALWGVNGEPMIMLVPVIIKIKNYNETLTFYLKGMDFFLLTRATCPK